MGQRLRLELSDAEYRALERLAEENGTSPGEWATHRLREHLAALPAEEAPTGVAPELVDLLRDVAESTGRSYEEVAAGFIRATAPQPRPKVSRAEAEAARKRFLQCTADLGYATGADNESIDADLAREYADSHECLDAPEEPRLPG